jgi:hypothetical protein
MKNSSWKLKHVGIALIAAIILAVLSVQVERTGPGMVQYGNLCGAPTSEPCYQPALTGGFPVAYLYDAPGVSRERQLSFVEDKLQVGALVSDIAIYFGILALVPWVVSRRSTVKSDAN